MHWGSGNDFNILSCLRIFSAFSEATRVSRCWCQKTGQPFRFFDLCQSPLIFKCWGLHFPLMIRNVCRSCFDLVAVSFSFPCACARFAELVKSLLLLDRTFAIVHIFVLLPADLICLAASPQLMNYFEHLAKNPRSRVGILDVRLMNLASAFDKAVESTSRTFCFTTDSPGVRGTTSPVVFGPVEQVSSHGTIVDTPKFNSGVLLS